MVESPLTRPRTVGILYKFRFKSKEDLVMFVLKYGHLVYKER